MNCGGSRRGKVAALGVFEYVVTPGGSPFTQCLSGIKPHSEAPKLETPPPHPPTPTL